MTQDVIRIRPAEDVDTQFLADLLNSKVGRKAVGGIAVQGTRKRVSLTDLKAVQLPKPPYEEQLCIGRVVATKRQKMEEERDYSEKLQHLKTGLMHDLLVGRVRVPEVEARVGEAVA